MRVPSTPPARSIRARSRFPSFKISSRPAGLTARRPPSPHRQVALPREGGAAGPPGAGERQQQASGAPSPRLRARLPLPERTPPSRRASRHSKFEISRSLRPTPQVTMEQPRATRSAMKASREVVVEDGFKYKRRKSGATQGGRQSGGAGRVPVAPPAVARGSRKSVNLDELGARSRSRRTIPASPFTRTSPRTSPRRSVCSSWWRRSARRSVAWSASG